MKVLFHAVPRLNNSVNSLVVIVAEGPNLNLVIALDTVYLFVRNKYSIIRNVIVFEIFKIKV